MTEDSPDARLDDMAAMLADEHGLVTVATRRRNGDPLLSIVNAGVMTHPVSGERVVAFVSAGRAARLGHIRSNGHLTVLVRRTWRWMSAAGTAELIGPDDGTDVLEATGTDLPTLLRDVFVAAGGTHDDWDTYDRVMAEERRCAVLMRPERFFGN